MYAESYAGSLFYLNLWFDFRKVSAMLQIFPHLVKWNEDGLVIANEAKQSVVFWFRWLGFVGINLPYFFVHLYR